MPKVSVIMTVYNTKEEFLREAIESVLSQTFSDFELLIMNDGSTEDVESVISSYKDERIKYFKHENSGVSKSRNELIDMATGEYIAVLDSDDVALPERFEKETKYLDENLDIAVVGSWYKTFPDITTIKTPENPRLLDCLKGCCFGHSTVMFRKNEFDKYNLRYDTNLVCAEDYDLWCRAAKILKFYNLQEVLLMYRSSGQNLSDLKRDEMIKSTIKIQKNILDSLSTSKKVQKDLVELAYADVKIGKCFGEKIFSIKNLYKYNVKYKIITVFGVELRLRSKVYGI